MSQVIRSAAAGILAAALWGVAEAESTSRRVGAHDTAAPLESPLSAPSHVLPPGLSVVVLIDDAWHVMIATESGVDLVPDVSYPRNVTYHRGADRLAWIGADGRLRERALATGRTTTLGDASSSARYTQPAYAPDGRWLDAVELPGGKSRTTRIVGFDLDSGERHRLVAKRTAQFEPQRTPDGRLHYTTALCVDDCPGMIWELWEKDLVEGRQRQLTLQNAVATHPKLGEDGWLYFSSNAAGDGFHIWRVRPEPGAPPEPLTQGAVRDSDPAPTPDGSVYFIRRRADGVDLMRLADGEEETVSLDARIRDLRDLEAGP